MIEIQGEQYFESYDLVAKLSQYNEELGDAWSWFGRPMIEIGPIQKRVIRERKAYGKRFVDYKIIRMRLNIKTGGVDCQVVEEGK